jgi:hypothetical protein
MSRGLLTRIVELERRRGTALSADAVPLATEALRAAGFTVYPWDNGAGLAVDEAPGLLEALDDLSARGSHPATVAILRRFDVEDENENASGAMEAARGSGDRAGAADGGVTSLRLGHPVLRSAKGAH